MGVHGLVGRSGTVLLGPKRGPGRLLPGAAIIALSAFALALVGAGAGACTHGD